MQTMEMKVRHVHTRAVHAELGRTRGHLVDIFQPNRSARHRPYYWRNFMSFKDKRSLTCCRVVDSSKLEWRHYLWRGGERGTHGGGKGLGLFLSRPKDLETLPPPHLLFCSSEQLCVYG